MKLGIIGTGWIAEKMALTLENLSCMDNQLALQDAMGLPRREETVERYAVASRDLAKAQAFADRFGFEKAYGSYEELAADPEVEIVYIATPHSRHYDNSMLCIEHGKHLLVEKAFTANVREAKALLAAAEAKNLFVMEAVWTRCMPLSMKVSELIAAGEIGEPRFLSASLIYQMDTKERILKPELCGGALLDLGVYSINFERMYFHDEPDRVVSSCSLYPTGTDAMDSMVYYWNDGRMADLRAGTSCRCNRQGHIAGTEGYIDVLNINCPEKVTLFKDYQEVAAFLPPKEQATGYEYEVLACLEAIRNGLLETPFMPHAETIRIMEIMDAFRAEWGVVFPNDERM